MEFVVGWVSTLSAVCVPAWFFIRKVNSFMRRISDLERWTLKQQLDIEQNRAEMTLLLSGTLACLKGLREQGCNGAVTKSIAEIEEFLLEQSAKTKSTAVCAC